MLGDEAFGFLAYSNKSPVLTHSSESFNRIFLALINVCIHTKALSVRIALLFIQLPKEHEFLLKTKRFVFLHQPVLNSY